MNVSLGDIIVLIGMIITAITTLGINEARSRKYEGEGAAKITEAAIKLMETTQIELDKFKSKQKVIIEILQIQSQEIGELWSEYEKVYGMAYLLHNQLRSQGLAPAGDLPPKRKPPQGGGITYDLD